jgi:transcriptional regulator
MYTPAVFAEQRMEVMHALIQQYPLATLVSAGPAGPDATHVPVVLHPDEGTAGLLRCHVARANPVWQAVEADPRVLLIFQGPQHYISPSWYPSKQERGEVVPTWNYVAVHVRGHARTFQDRTNLIQHVSALTNQSERARADPWSLDDAPREYVEKLSAAIVGIEVTVEHLEGKWKVSQNRPGRDRIGVLEALRSLDTDASRAMAALMSETASRLP